MIEKILRLSLSDPNFSCICDDLVLACDTLARYEARSDADRRPEVAEYRTVILELEREIRERLVTARW
jgi:hypothetical protein